MLILILLMNSPFCRRCCVCVILRLIEFGNIEFLCEYFGQKVDKKDDDQQDSGNSEGCVILCLGHAQVQLDRKGSAGFEDFFEKSCKGLGQKIAASGGE